MENYDTVSQAINALSAQGYNEDFNQKDGMLICRNGEVCLRPADFNIDKFFRFEGESNPDDEAIVYAISSDAYNVKGVLVNAYGIYSDIDSDELMKKLRITY